MVGVYSLPLIALSYVVAMVASYVALDLAGRVTVARGRLAYYWLGGGAVAMGVGIWSMHFIGMLAFRLPIPMAYDPWITFLSMLIAILVSGFALRTVGRRSLTWTRLLTAGAAMGVGIAGMHYTGMAALRVSPGIHYDLPMLSASVAIAIGASCAALWLAFQLRSDTVPHVVWKKLGSAAVMGAAIAGMHYTGMAAAHFSAGTICTLPEQQVHGSWLAATVADTAILLLVALMLISIIDARLARRLEAAYSTISEMAQKDPLTGLANRAAFLERLSSAVEAAVRGGEGFALLMLDIDHFKNANDTLGHPVGDQLLQAVGGRLAVTVRQSDLVARLGGDEFAILQMGVASKEAAATSAARILNVFATPYQADGKELRITASIGIALSAVASEAEAMMRQADLALYHAKDEGRNCFRLHEPHLDRDVHDRVTLADELAAGIERGELALVYQPQVELPSGRMIGVEALVRWQHPTRGLVMPAVFIPIAERTGSIIALGDWVLEEACRQLSCWLAEGLNPGVVAVNVSALQFKGPTDFAQSISDTLERWRIRPNQIELELTESVLMEATQEHGATFERLRKLGVGIAIDDFGTGYSSFNYLTSYPATRLKIAQELVSQVNADPRNAAVVRAAIALAHELGLEAIAEGVETAALASFLAEADCEHAQGYHFSRPIGVAQITELLRQPAAMLPVRDTGSPATAGHVETPPERPVAVAAIRTV